MLNECLDSRCVMNRYSYCSIGMSDAPPRALELGALQTAKGQPCSVGALLACNRPYKTYKDYGTHCLRARMTKYEYGTYVQYITPAAPPFFGCDLKTIINPRTILVPIRKLFAICNAL